MKKTLICLFCLFLTTAGWAGVRAQLRQGGKLYKEGKYGQALNQYIQAAQEEPENAQVLFNAGDAYYQLKEYTNAQNAFKAVAEQDTPYAQDALFNLATSYYRAGDKQNAIKAYQAAILKNPQDKEAIHNLQLILQEKNSRSGQNQNNNNKSDDSKNQQQQDNQDNKDGQGSSDENKQDTSPSPYKQDMKKEDAQRVMQLAKENEYKRPASAGQGEGSALVEKDW